MNASGAQTDMPHQGALGFNIELPDCFFQDIPMNLSIYCGDSRRHNYKSHGFRRRGRADALPPPSLFICNGDSHHLDLRFQASIIPSLAISTPSVVENSHASAAWSCADTGFCLSILLHTGHDNKSYTEHADRFWPSSMLVSRANKPALK